MQVNTQPQDNHKTPDTQWTSTNPTEHKQDGQDNLCTETSQMETSETPECMEATNNMKTLNGGTNHQQVLHKHNSATTEVEDSEPNSESLNDRYDRTENKSPPTDDEHQQMTLSGSPKRIKNYEQNEN
jgi:hypothetical protein